MQNLVSASIGALTAVLVQSCIEFFRSKRCLRMDAKEHDRHKPPNKPILLILKVTIGNPSWVPKTIYDFRYTLPDGYQHKALIPCYDAKSACWKYYSDIGERLLHHSEVPILPLDVEPLRSCGLTMYVELTKDVGSESDITLRIDALGRKNNSIAHCFVELISLR